MTRYGISFCNVLLKNFTSCTRLVLSGCGQGVGLAAGGGLLAWWWKGVWQYIGARHHPAVSILERSLSIGERRAVPRKVSSAMNLFVPIRCLFKSTKAAMGDHCGLNFLASGSIPW